MARDYCCEKWQEKDGRKTMAGKRAPDASEKVVTRA
jgi:hypothetical protein